VSAKLKRHCILPYEDKNLAVKAGFSGQEKKRFFNASLMGLEQAVPPLGKWKLSACFN
jgi:hypothetical protein